MKLSAIVVDDEPLALSLMESYVKKTPFLDLKGSFGSGVLAYNFLADNHVDLVFSDIQMPGLGGMELSRMLPEDTKVIFTTAFSNYAVEGFKVNAIDYLLKPISYNDFLAAARKALDWFELKAKAEVSPAATAAQSDKPSSIFVKTEYKLQQIEFSDILYIEGFKDYVRIYTESSPEPILSLISMKTLEAQLPSDTFLRIHRSFIVNMTKVKVIERGSIRFGDRLLPVADSARDRFYTFLASRSILLKD